MKLRDKDKAVLLVIAGLAIVAIVFFFVFRNFNDKTSTLASENSTLEQEVATLEQMNANKQNVIDDTNDTADRIKDILDLYPSAVYTEDIIKDLHDMYSSIPSVKVSSESFTMNQPFYGAGAVAEGDTSATAETTTDVNAAAQTQPAAVESTGDDAKDIINNAGNYAGYRSDVSISMTSNYRGLKRVIDYINKNKDRMTVNNLTVSAGGDSPDQLSSSMTISMYSVANTGKKYESPKIRGVHDGKNNIFKRALQR